MGNKYPLIEPTIFYQCEITPKTKHPYLIAIPYPKNRLSPQAQPP